MQPGVSFTAINEKGASTVAATVAGELVVLPGTRHYEGSAYVVSATQPIGCHAFADGDGLDATPFIGTEFRNRYDAWPALAAALRPSLHRSGATAPPCRRAREFMVPMDAEFVAFSTHEAPASTPTPWEGAPEAGDWQLLFDLDLPVNTGGWKQAASVPYASTDAAFDACPQQRRVAYRLQVRPVRMCLACRSGKRWSSDTQGGLHAAR